VRSIRSFLVAATLSSAILVGLAAPAAAVKIVATYGSFGDYGFTPADAASTPAGKCGYSGVLADNYAHLRWIRVRPPSAVSQPGRDQQRVSWQVVVQRERNTGGWKTVAKSGNQYRTAYSGVSADFDPIKVYYKGSLGQKLRALAVIKWWRKGEVQAWVKMWIEYYGVKWTVGTPDFVYNDSCDGAAD